MNTPKIFNRAKRILTLTAATLLLGGVLAPSSALYPISARTTTTNTAVQTIQPAWKKIVAAQNKPQFDTTITNEGLVIYKAGVYLAAADLKTGKAKWTYKSTPASTPTYSSNYVYYADTAGRIHKVNGKTGKGVWVKPGVGSKAKEGPYEASSVEVYDGMVIVADQHGLAAYDLNSGKLRWNTESQTGYGYKIEYMGGTIVASSVSSGAITTNPIYGISTYTGQVKWALDGDYKQIMSGSNGTVIAVRNNNGLDQGYALTIDLIEYGTGKKLQTFQYEPVDFVEQQSAYLVDSTLDSIYFVQANDNGGSTLSRIPFNAPTQSKAMPVYTSDSRITHLDIKDKLWIGFQDGRLLAKDATTMMDKFIYKVASGNFIGIEVVDQQLLIQSGGRIYGATLPTQSK